MCLCKYYLLTFSLHLLRIFSVAGVCRDSLKLFDSFSEVKTYDPSGDSTLPTCSKKRKIEQVDDEGEVTEKKAKKAKIKIKGEFECFGVS